MTPQSWEGKDRRDKDSGSDHDLLTRIDERLGTFINELNELKTKVAWHDKVIYIGIGGLAVLQIIFKVLN